MVRGANQKNSEERMRGGLQATKTALKRAGRGAKRRGLVGLVWAGSYSGTVLAVHCACTVLFPYLAQKEEKKD